MSDRNEIASRVTAALEGKPAPVVVRGAHKVDTCGERCGYQVVSGTAGVIMVAGTGEGAFEHCYRTMGLDPADRNAVTDAEGRILTPGYVDIYAYDAWKKSFDDGPDGIDATRVGHAVHGTMHQVLSLITNPVNVICRNIHIIRATMGPGRPDILGCHPEGPSLVPARKGAYDPECLKDPVPDVVDKMLEASGVDPTSGKLGRIRQITIAPELPHGILATRQFAAAGVVPAVGHCDTNYETAKANFDADAGIMTHMFNAVDGLHHCEPDPVPVVMEDSCVTIEFVNGGFHVQDPMVSLSFRFVPHRTAFVANTMAATDCPNGVYKLDALGMNMVDGYAHLVSNGVITGSALLLEVTIRRVMCELGFSPVDAVEAVTLTPTKTFSPDRPNPVTGVSTGLITLGFAADFNPADPADWTVEQM